MIRTFALAGLALALLAGPAAAASFDCGKARAKVEKLICADRELSRQDEALATAYAGALKAWDGRIADYVRLTQRHWMASRALLPRGVDMGGVYCTDDAERLDCLRGLYRDRISVLSGPAFRLSGVYERGKDFLRIKAVPGGLEFAYAMGDAAMTQGFTQEGAPVAVAAGAARVTFPLLGEGGDACRLEGAFTAEAVVLTQHGPCSGQSLAGRWVRNPTRDPDGELF